MSDETEVKGPVIEMERLPTQSEQITVTIGGSNANEARSMDQDEVPVHAGDLLEKYPDLSVSDAMNAERMSSTQKDAKALVGMAKAKKLTSFQQYNTIDDKYFRPSVGTIAKLPAAMYRVLSDNSGIFFAKDDITSDELILMPDSKTDLILNEIKKFRDLKAKYKSYGLLHKRGLLLYGPPGSGKSSSIVMVARDMIEKGDIVLMCQHPGLVSEAIRVITDIEPTRNLVVVIEDIDDVIGRHGEHLILNVLDGDHQVDNIVFLATTNYIDRLPPRIINRPSRFDRLVEIGMPNETARQLFFQNKVGSHMYKDSKGESYNLVSLTEGLSLAHLREIIASVYCLDIPVDEVVARMRKMAIPPKTKLGVREKKMGIGMGNEVDYGKGEDDDEDSSF